MLLAIDVGNTNKFSGAVVGAVVGEAMHSAFSESREFTLNDIIESVRQFVPLAYTNQEKIEFLEDWALSGKARLASSPEIKGKNE